MQKKKIQNMIHTTTKLVLFIIMIKYVRSNISRTLYISLIENIMNIFQMIERCGNRRFLDNTSARKSVEESDAEALVLRTI